MIRTLGDGDRDKVLAFLDHEHEHNLVMIYDVTHYGLDDHGLPFQGSYFGAFRQGELKGIAAFFNLGSLFVCVPDPGLAGELAERVSALERRPRFVMGRTDWVSPFLDRFSELGLHALCWEEQDSMLLDPGAFRPRFRPEARFAEPRDLDRLIELNRAFQLEYFGRLDEAEEELGRMADVRMRDCGIAVASVDGEIASKAEVMVRTSRAALIGGVYTMPGLRGTGLSFACMSLLCQGILGSTGKACLNVARDNLPARRVYSGIGFRKVGDCLMACFA